MIELNAAARHTLAIRQAELAGVLAAIRIKPARILEIGAGNGWHSKLLAEQGHQVDAIDTEPWQHSLHPVQAYDGRDLPFADGSFDVVFSSSVLEHIPDLDHTQAEIYRVLKDDGVALHITPTPTWRVLTTLTYYPRPPWIIAGAFGHLRKRNGRDAAAAPGAVTMTAVQPLRRSPLRRGLKWLATLAISPRHGERGNRLTEAWYFRRKWWENLFHSHGFDVIDSKGLDIFYSGNILLGQTLPLSARAKLARLFGPSSCLFVLRKARPSVRS